MLDELSYKSPLLNESTGESTLAASKEYSYEPFSVLFLGKKSTLSGQKEYSLGVANRKEYSFRIAHRENIAYLPLILEDKHLPIRVKFRIFVPRN